jgi:hypothetical protein
MTHLRTILVAAPTAVLDAVVPPYSPPPHANAAPNHYSYLQLFFNRKIYSTCFKLILFLYYPPPDGNTLCHPLPPTRAHALLSRASNSCTQFYHDGGGGGIPDQHTTINYMTAAEEMAAVMVTAMLMATAMSTMTARTTALTAGMMALTASMTAQRQGRQRWQRR